MRFVRMGVLAALLMTLILAVIGVANGQTGAPTVTAVKAIGSPADPTDSFWSSVNGTTIKTSGNPSKGGHGSVPRTPDILVKAAYTKDNLYMFFEWSDPTNDNIYGYWTYDAKQQKWIKSSGDEVNEDRLYLSWPIVDVPGRGGETFAEAGCASICHAMDDKNMITPSEKPVNDCGDCHNNAVEKPATFSHTSDGACDSCHIDKSPSTLADMVAPEGGSYDIWHWKAGRAGNMGFADDQSTINGKKRGNDGSPGLDKDNVNADKKAPKYVWALNASNTASTGTYDNVVKESTVSQMVELSDDGKTIKDTGVAVPDGTTVRAKILNDQTGHANNKNISSTHRYADGKYRVVLKRKMNTGDSKDYAFKLNEANLFGIAVTDNGSSNHAGNALVKLMFSNQVIPAPSFGDVANSHWAFEYIEDLVELGIINGFPGKVFKPSDTTTRAEFAKILVSALNEAPKTGDGGKFNDTANHWAAGYIEKAADLGIIKGYPTGDFRPNNKVTRAEAVIMVTRAFELEATDDQVSFTDVATDYFAYTEIATAYKHGLISGYPGNIFKPAANINRAEAAKITSLALQK